MQVPQSHNSQPALQDVGVDAGAGADAYAACQVPFRYVHHVWVLSFVCRCTDGLLFVGGRVMWIVLDLTAVLGDRCVYIRAYVPTYICMHEGTDGERFCDEERGIGEGCIGWDFWEIQVRMDLDLGCTYSCGLHDDVGVLDNDEMVSTQSVSGKGRERR